MRPVQRWSIRRTSLKVFTPSRERYSLPWNLDATEEIKACCYIVMWCPTNVDSVNSEAENSNVQESQEEDKFSKQQEVVDIDGL